MIRAHSQNIRPLEKAASEESLLALKLREAIERKKREHIEPALTQGEER